MPQIQQGKVPFFLQIHQQVHQLVVAGVIVAGGGVKDDGAVPFFPHHGQHSLHAADSGGNIKVLRPEAAADPPRDTAEGGVIG